MTHTYTLSKRDILTFYRGYRPSSKGNVMIGKLFKQLKGRYSYKLWPCDVYGTSVTDDLADDFWAHFAGIIIESEEVRFTVQVRFWQLNHRTNHRTLYATITVCHRAAERFVGRYELAGL